MRSIQITLFFAVITLFTSIEAYAQHNVDLDDGATHYTQLQSQTVNPLAIFTFPALGGTIATTSSTWSLNGNAGTVPPGNPLSINLTTNNFIGTTDNTELDFVTNGVVRARFKNSTGDSSSVFPSADHTGTTGAFEPGIGNIYTLGTLDRPWKGLFISPGTITFTASTGAHKPGDHNPSPTSFIPATFSFDTVASEFVLSNPLTISGTGGSVKTSSITITGGSFPGGGMVKANPGGILAIASGGVDYENPLLFKNGLTRTADSITLGGNLTHSLSFTGGGNVAFNETGSFTIASLTGGLVKSTAGVLSNAIAGTDYESALTFSNGLIRTVNSVTLGGLLTSDVNISGATKNIYITNPGDFGIGTASATTGLLEVQCTTKTAFRALAGGSSGSAGAFNQNNASNANHALIVSTPGSGNAVDASTSGAGWAGHFDGTGASSKGIYASGGAGQTGLQVNNGSVILSETNQPVGAFAIGSGTNAVVNISSGAVAGFNISLNTGTNGQIVYVFNGNAVSIGTLIAGTSGLLASNTGGNTIAPGKTMILIYLSDPPAGLNGWVTK